MKIVWRSGCFLLVLSCGTAHADFGDTAPFFEEGAHATGKLALSRVSSGKVNSTAILAAHNKWRAEVGVPGLVYSKSLASSAQAWAESLKNTNRCKMKHSGSEVGENLFWQSAVSWSDGTVELQRVDPRDVVDAWGSEKRHYSHAENACDPSTVCGHYTQLVWKQTTAVGCGMAICGSQDQIWVCQYAPAGNWVGQRPY